MSEQTTTKNIQQAYDEQYNSGEGEWRMIGAIKKAENIFDITKNLGLFEKVVEVGAGEGSLLKILAQNPQFAKEVYALEISNSGIAAIKEKNIENLKEVLKFDGYHTPYPDKYFDLAVVAHVLEHVEHERLFLREVARISKKQVIEVPRDHAFGVDKKVKHFLSYGHLNLYTPSSLKFLLQTEGFNILENHNKIYNIETFQFGKTGFKRLKATLVFYAKTLFSSTPFDKFNHLFVNTITVLTEAGKPMNIF